eukprot:406659-Alexandrium_andersonii.AAC.1
MDRDISRSAPANPLIADFGLGHSLQSATMTWKCLRSATIFTVDNPLTGCTCRSPRPDGASGLHWTCSRPPQSRIERHTKKSW